MVFEKDEIAKHYNENKGFDIKDRKNIKTIHIRNMNNLIKSFLVKLFVNQNDSVLDIGCGKGGDLLKFKNAGIRYYVGIDIAEVSLKEAKKRFLNCNAMFNADFYKIDAFNEKIALDQVFDVVSCQFCFHYAFATQNSVQIALSNISKHLKTNGVFIATIPDSETLLRRYEKYGNGHGNEYHNITFKEEIADIRKLDVKIGVEYYFNLIESVVNCVEYLIDDVYLSQKAKKHNLVLEYSIGFLEFFNQNYKQYHELYTANIKKRLSIEEQRVVELYKIVVFRKI